MPGASIWKVNLVSSVSCLVTPPLFSGVDASCPSSDVLSFLLCPSPTASAFIIAMLLASLNSCCNPWIYMLFTGHLFHELVQRFLCCSSSHLKTSRPGETSVSKKSNSSTFVLSQHSSSQKSCS